MTSHEMKENSSKQPQSPNHMKMKKKKTTLRHCYYKNKPNEVPFIFIYGLI